MGKRALTGIMMGLCVLAAAQADPLDRNEIGRGANWLVHADLDAFRGSTLGSLVMAELKAQGVEQKLQDFVTIFSVDPLRDISGVTLYGTGQDRNNAVVVVDGKFDPEKLLAVVRWNPQYQEIPYQGATIHQWPNEEKKGSQTTTRMMYGTILDGRKIVLSTGLDTVKQAVDAIKSPAAGASTDLLKQVPEGRGGVFLQLAAVEVGKIVGEDPKAAIIKQAESLALTIGETGGKVLAAADVRSQTTDVAQNMTKFLQGVVAMAQLAGQEQPKLSELAGNVAVSQEDRTTRVRFEAAAQSIFGFLKEQWEKKNQQQQTSQGAVP